MDLLSAGKNRKGFIHHPETPSEDKLFYFQHKEKAAELLHIGEAFLKNDGVVTLRSVPRGIEQIGANARNLHRGFYCPSPVIDILVMNAKRGKIMIRPSARSKITNRYVYDTANKLIFVDNYIDGKMVSSEYLQYQNDIVYGITVGMRSDLIGISEEVYLDGRLRSYIYANYSRFEDNLACYQMDCEIYHYDDLGLMGWNHYQLYYGWERVAPSGYIKHNRYSLARQDGWLTEYTQTNLDGSPINGSIANEIKIKRKA